MPRSTLVNPARLRSLVATVAAFYIRDRPMQHAQAQIVHLLAAGDPDPSAVALYLRAVERYFEGFAREARAQLAYVDRELERSYARQFNLTAERGVAARRVEATQGVLSSVAEIAPQ